METLLPEVIYLRNTSYNADEYICLFVTSEEYTHDNQLEYDTNDIHPEAEVPLLCVVPTMKEDSIRIKGRTNEAVRPTNLMATVVEFNRFVPRMSLPTQVI